MLIAACSVAGTAWLAVQTTTSAIREEQGQVLSEDTDILRQLSGWAAMHPSWTGVSGELRTLSRKTGRRIALTTADRKPIADSAAGRIPLPPRAAATVDPLHTDTYTEPGAQITGIDPRAVGPYRLTGPERRKVRMLAETRSTCARKGGVDTRVVQTPTGRSVLVGEDGSTDVSVPQECADGMLNTPVPTEEQAGKKLIDDAQACLTRNGQSSAAIKPPYLSIDFGAQHFTYRYSFKDPAGHTAAENQRAEDCLGSARRAQLDPYVAPAAELFLGGADTVQPSFDMSTANKAKVVAVAALVLALTVAVTVVVGLRLVRPLRALTQAARQMPERQLRVPVGTRDETGILAAAFNDLTERRERIEAQRKAMVSDIAHELRTPLTNIRGWLEVARDGIVAPDPDLLAALHDEAVVLQRVIDDLQDLAAADAGTLRLHKEPVGADELLEQVAAAHRVAAGAGGIRLATTVQGDPWVEADPVRMRQALGNLVSNAVRHTPAGGSITLSARTDGDLVLFEVADTGSGIAPQDLPHVFDRFWRAEKSRSRRTGGSGLGLAIVRQLAGAHGGTVTAESEPGAGSVFRLGLPSRPEPPPVSGSGAG
ncbi:cell wall metabolism sensor histidine kinase WalK [Streptomyces sp. TS71-3]|uniref:sensor histidine kinase n=1 Tax=Streptomyces sp. TS71-3 TaxID=2733862 RepID=UPI0020174C79|nr:HAMP domain-containing sensor histidine kinase [Streptomyces sp. TS71-3]